jgi:hypothetical protein
MKTLYWIVEIVRPDHSDDHRCVMLHGQSGEIGGPMTPELAEKWMKHFDGSNLVSSQKNRGASY